MSEVKGQNKYLASELALTKYSMAYLFGQNKDLRDQLHQANSANSKLNAFFKTPPQPAYSSVSVVHEEQ